MGADSKRVEGDDGGGVSGWQRVAVAMGGSGWLMGPMERSKMSEGRKREYCERESENERERAHEILTEKVRGKKIWGSFVRGKE